jgi:hypothetical protein
MAKPVRVLLVEDSEDDAELIALELRRSGYGATCRPVETEPEFRACLSAPFDVILGPRPPRCRSSLTTTASGSPSPSPTMAVASSHMPAAWLPASRAVWACWACRNDFHSFKGTLRLHLCPARARAWWRRLPGESRTRPQPATARASASPLTAPLEVTEAVALR